MEKNPPSAEEVFEYASRIAIPFSEIERAIKNSTGESFETDGEHSTSLALVACAVADRIGLDTGKVAQYAIVHDVVEVYAGDTDVWASKEERESKHEREMAALDRIKTEFDDSFPWLGRMISAYENLEDDEARLVKSLDKVMPAIMHLMNEGEYFKREGVTYEMHLMKIAERHEAAALHPVSAGIRLELLKIYDEKRIELFGASS